ncbi:MAG: DinB family protein [Planctomycetes bacterium]|nr:DinB family protein [Planctomycetota bacterium]
MHARTHELLEHLDAGRRELLAVVDAAPVGDRERAPAAGRWSLANILSHLARTEGQIAAFLQRGLRRLLASGEAPPLPARLPPVLTRFEATSVLDRTQRITAPEFAEPDPEMNAVAALAQLERARERLREVLLAADGRDARGLRQLHQVFGELDFYEWVAFAGYHERRHTEQAREVAEALRQMH